MPIKTRKDKKYHDALVWTCIGLGILLPMIYAGAKGRDLYFQCLGVIARTQPDECRAGQFESL
jgi:hypothetical protein